MPASQPVYRGGPVPLPREHGTMRGFCQHKARGEKQCDPCIAAERQWRADRNARIRAEQEARRQRWRQLDQEAS